MQAPPLRLVALEARLIAELPRFLLATRALDHLPRGDGHAVMVVPGWGLDDRPTLPLRLVLGRLGYAAYGWEMGRNMGRRPGLAERLDARIHELRDRHATTADGVSLIGWSLGGVVVREAARRQPEVVRRVFSLGSPINGDPEANNVTALLKLLGRHRGSVDHAAFEARRVPPPVASVAIYTKSDGVVAWQCALEEPAAHTENVEVRGSHAGLIVNVEVLAALAERLPRPPFEAGQGPSPRGHAAL